MRQIYSEAAPMPEGHYVQGWEHNGFIFVSGQLPIIAETKEKYTGSAAEQAAQSLKNVKAILEAGGSGLNKVLKVTVYISDIAFWNEVNDVYSAFFGEHKPARSIVPTRDLHFGFKVEIEAIAVI